MPTGKMNNKKSQEAIIEFLMTYGWAILASVIAIAVLAYFGVFNPNHYLNSENQSCSNNESLCLNMTNFVAGKFNTSEYNIYLNCDYVNVYLSYDNKTIEFCEWFKNETK